MGVAMLLVLGISLIVVLRLFRIMRRPHPGRISKRREASAALLIVLGSGGHTAEMLAILRNMPAMRYSYRMYVVSSGDTFSADKAREFEANLNNGSHDNLKLVEYSSPGSYDIAVVPRARRIYQGLLTTPFSCLYCLVACLRLLHMPAHSKTSSASRSKYSYPDLIISNGPATGVIVVLASLIVRFFGLPASSDKMRTIYVESWARVTKLSLSGMILLPIVDRFIVQWEQLVEITRGRAEYVGVLV